MRVYQPFYKVRCFKAFPQARFMRGRNKTEKSAVGTDRHRHTNGKRALLLTDRRTNIKRAPLRGALRRLIQEVFREEFRK